MGAGCRELQTPEGRPGRFIDAGVAIAVATKQLWLTASELDKEGPAVDFPPAPGLGRPRGEVPARAGPFPRGGACRHRRSRPCGQRRDVRAPDRRGGRLGREPGGRGVPAATTPLLRRMLGADHPRFPVRAGRPPGGAPHRSQLRPPGPAPQPTARLLVDHHHTSGSGRCINVEPGALGWPPGLRRAALRSARAASRRSARVLRAGSLSVDGGNEEFCEFWPTGAPARPPSPGAPRSSPTAPPPTPATQRWPRWLRLVRGDVSTAGRVGPRPGPWIGRAWKWSGLPRFVRRRSVGGCFAHLGEVTGGRRCGRR